MRRRQLSERPVLETVVRVFGPAERLEPALVRHDELPRLDNPQADVEAGGV